MSNHVPGRGRVYNSITETIGDTPLVRLDKFAKQKGIVANLLAKLEFFNPIASVKDRIGVAMIERSKRQAGSRPARTRWSSRPPATPVSRSPSRRPPRVTS